MLDPQLFTLISQDIQNSIHALLDTFVTMGQELAAIIVLIQASYRIVLTLLSPNESLFSSLWPTVWRYGCLLFLLRHWDQVSHLFFDTVHDCSHHILIHAQSMNVLSQLHHMIDRILHTDSSAITQQLEGLALVTRIIEAKVIAGITALMLIILMIVYLFIMNIGLILLGVGLILGPLLLPLYLLSWTDFLLDGWLRFMITAVLYQLVGSTLLVILHTIMKHLSLISEQMIYNASIPIDYDLSVLILTMMLCLLAILMMLQTPSIASSLASGARILNHIRPTLPSPTYMIQKIQQLKISRDIARAQENDRNH